MLGAWINGWWLAAPLAVVAALGVLSNGLTLLVTWWQRADRAGRPPRPPAPTVWPGDPHRAWQQSTGDARLPRLAPPPRYSTFEEFLAAEPSPQRAAGVIGIVGVSASVLLGGALLVAPPVVGTTGPGSERVQGALVMAFWVVAVAALPLGLLTWWPPRRRRLLRAQHARAVAIGVLCGVRPTELAIFRRDEGRTQFRLFVDARTSPAQASRIAAALDRWAAQITEEAGTDRPLGAAIDFHMEDAWGLRDAVRTEDLFGPDAGGAYLVATSHPAGGWAVLIEMNAVDGDITPFRWVEKVFFRQQDEGSRAVSDAGGATRRTPRGTR